MDTETTQTSETLDARPDGISESAFALLRARQLAQHGRRVLLGVVGAPGAGKSTLGDALVRELGAQVVCIGMDGFHLANRQLDEQGLRARKGSIETFDGAGLLALLRRLKDPGAEPVYAPEFDRRLDEPVAGAIAVAPTTPLVVVEGNYLLCDRGPWSDVAGLLDETWFLHVEEVERVSRLIKRHMSFGMPKDRAINWVYQVDHPNAEVVYGSISRADAILAEDGTLFDA